MESSLEYLVKEDVIQTGVKSLVPLFKHIIGKDAILELYLIDFQNFENIYNAYLIDLEGNKRKVKDVVEAGIPQNGLNLVNEITKITNEYNWPKTIHLKGLNGEKASLIYFPRKPINQALYHPSGELHLKGFLALGEEVFHAMDPIENIIVKEATAVLGRYSILRKLEENKNNDINSLRKENHIINLSLGFKLKDEAYLPQEYCQRLCLVGLLKNLEKEKPYKAIIKVKKVYNQIKNSPDQIKSIKELGYKYNHF